MVHEGKGFEFGRSTIEAGVSIPDVTARVWNWDWAEPLAYERHAPAYLISLLLTSPFRNASVSLRTNQCLGQPRTPGCLLFVAADSHYKIDAPPGAMRCLIVEFDPDRFERLTGFRRRWRPALLSACVNMKHPQLTQGLLHLAREVQAPGLASRNFVEGLTTQIAIQTMRYLGCASSETGITGPVLSAWQMRRIVHYLDTMQGYMPDVAKLAELCGIGDRHLRRLFKQTTGMTVTEYAREAWVSRTKRQLADSTLALKKVAMLAGFSDPCNFATTFRRMAGLTPKAFREHIRASG